MFRGAAECTFSRDQSDITGETKGQNKSYSVTVWRITDSDPFSRQLRGSLEKYHSLNC
jgi:hypothetical protein